MGDMVDTVDTDLAIGEGRGGLLKLSLTIFMVDMVDLAIMDIVDSDIMDMPDMVDMVDLAIMDIVDLDIMDMPDMVDMDLAIGEESGGLLKQIQRLRQILTIFMVDMVDLDIMDIVVLDIMDMPDMVVIMDTENRAVQQLLPKNQYCNNSNHKYTMLD